MKSNKENSIILFNQKGIRRVWVEEKDSWYFSVVDIIAVLTDSSHPNRYWSDLKRGIIAEGSQLYDKIVHLRLLALDNKTYLTDCLSTQDVLRLIQSIPSPKAEPFKLWLAKVGYERIEETEDPEQAFSRALKTYLRKGYSKEWINQRLKSIEVRKELTDEWKERGMKEGSDFAILTNEITKAWSEMSVKEYKRFKNLKKQNLRDNMTNLELVLNMLAEATTSEISKVKQPEGLPQNKAVAKEGGSIAGSTRKQIESATGKGIITSSSSTNNTTPKIGKL